MPARRSNYALVSQTDEYLEQDSFNHIQYQHNYNQRLHHQQQPQQQSQPQPQDHSADKWGYVVDTDRQGWERDRGRASCSSGGGGLQRQSSGSSFAESSVSSDYPLPTLTLSPSASDSNIFHDTASNAERCVLAGNNNACSYSSKNWAQQREESYHLQVAVALRVSSEAFSTDDPHLLGGPSFELRAASGSGSGPKSSHLNVEAVSHRFWVTGCLSYFDKISDGFYYIWGMNPFVWTMCNDMRESRMPSLESLKSVDASESSFEVILIDKRGDSCLRELENKVLTLAYGTAGTKEKVVEKLGDLVCKHMGGTSSFEDHELIAKWDSTSKRLRSCLNSIVLPIGNLSVGLCRHRALLFKALADAINLPCRIARGCKYCGRDDGSSCMVRYANDREYLVDLIGKPGHMCEPDSFLNGPTSLMVSSPLRLPDLKSSLFNEELCSLVKQYMMDFTSSDILKNAQTTETPSPLEPANSTSDLQCVVSVTNTGPPAEPLLSVEPMKSKPFNSQLPGAANLKLSSSKLSEKGLINDSISLGRIGESVGVLSGKSNFELSLAMDGLEIPWSKLELKERIGQGSFGTVYHADWQDSDVAVKILSDQDFYEERVKEFLREVAIMKRLRHPNVVLFMGAVLSPNLAIVTEYLPRGSLYCLIHRPGVREHLDERKRLRMALDVAKGMNYLHRHNPPIVHRDLKSPNLLVDKSWTVKVCDFGLSRLKANTFLSSKSAAGTPEWMAPEVLRDEHSNEKSDIYSFGVILWELITLQQPWTGLNPAQVVGAVGFQNRRLHIPRDVSPEIATVIESCWANDPWKRPSFAGIMDSLKPLLKSPISQQSHIGITSPH